MLGLEAAKVFWSLNTRSIRKKLDCILESGAPLTQYTDEPVAKAEDAIRMLSREVPLPIRNPLSDILENSDERLAQLQSKLRRLQQSGRSNADLALLLQQIERETWRAESKKKYKEQQQQYVEMHAIRLGDIAILAMWGEPYCEIGLEVKQKSPFAQTLFAAYLGGDLGYIGTPEMYLPNPPFEIDISPFAPAAANLVVEAASDLLRAIGEK